MEGLTEGRIVHYVLGQWDGTHYPGDNRPAIVVHVWRKGDGSPPDNGCCNIQVFMDGSNDKDGDSMMWKTSVLYDEAGGLGTWHWIEKA